jgi:TPR repeat protein
VKLRKLAETGNPSAQHNLALRLTIGDESKRDYPQAAEWYRKAAAQGMSESAFNLGVLYKAGANGIPKNVQEECRWFEQAAEAGLPNGMYQFSLCLGRTPDAVEWARKAAYAGVADAASELGIKIVYGHGTPQDIKHGTEWIKRAAEMGSPVGMFNYAISLKEGIGGKKDQQLAFEWLTKAVAAGHCSSYNSLATYYLNGVIVPKDEKKALELIYAGAKSGHKDALERLAQIFQNGELGQAKDSTKAASVRAATPTCGL